jgi:hypothetical protein
VDRLKPVPTRRAISVCRRRNARRRPCRLSSGGLRPAPS